MEAFLQMGAPAAFVFVSAVAGLSVTTIVRICMQDAKRDREYKERQNLLMTSKTIDHEPRG